MKIKRCIVSATRWMVMLLIALAAPSVLGQSVEMSFGEKIDHLASVVPEYEQAQNRFVNDFGPPAVPILTDKLLQSLHEGISPEAVGVGVFMLMPIVDQKRADRQIGYVAMEGIALRRMVLSPGVREGAVNALIQALRSPYRGARHTAVTYLGPSLGSQAVNHLLPMLNDVDTSVRYQTIETLVSIGDAQTADLLATALQNRRRSLNPTQTKEDTSLQEGDKAVQTLRAKFRTLASPTP